MALPSEGWSFPEVTAVGEGRSGGQIGCFLAISGLSTAISISLVSREGRCRKRKRGMSEGCGCFQVLTGVHVRSGSCVTSTFVLVNGVKGGLYNLTIQNENA
jgi:hypothetical protein